MNLFAHLTEMGKKMLASIMLVGIFGFVVGTTFTPQKAEAITDNWGYELIAALKTGYTVVATLAVQALGLQMNTKEFVLDPIVWAMMNMLLKSMLKDMTAWIRSGFQGEPAFVRDLDSFTKSIADRVVGSFLWKGNLNFLCSPFQLDIKLALELQYAQTRDFGTQQQCTLSGFINNAESFFKGDFLQGGWDGWFAVTANPVNSPYGSLVLAQDQMYVRIRNAQNQEIRLLDWGKGLFSQKECKFKPTDEETPTDCKIVSPGTTIENQINIALGSGQRRIEIADEFNEMFSVLFASLATTVFKKGVGLFGLGGGESGSDTSYFDAIGGANDVMYGETKTDDPTSMKGQLAIENDYMLALQEGIDLIRDAESYKNDAWGRSNRCHSGDIPTDLRNEIAKFEAEMSATRPIVTAITQLLDDYDSLGSVDIATEKEILDRYGVGTAPEAKNAIMLAYTSMRQSLHSVIDPEQVRQDENYSPSVAKIQKMITAFKSQVDAACQGSGGNNNSNTNTVDIYNPTSVGDALSDALDIEGDLAAELTKVIADIRDAARYKATTYGASNQCHTGNLSGTLLTKQDELTAELTEVQTVIDALELLSADLTEFYDDRVQVSGDRYRDLINTYGMSVSVGINQQFELIAEEDLLHTASYVRNVKNSVSETVADLIDEHIQEVDAACS